MSTLAAMIPAALYRPPAAPPAASTPRLLAPAEGRAMRLLGETVTVKVAAAQTGNAYSLFELVCPPGAGAPPHREPSDEVFVVLEGELTLMIDWRERAAGAGTCAFVPRGTAHGYANRSARPARALVLCSPGAGKEAMFAALACHAAMGGPGGGPPDMRAVAAICAEFGVELLSGPPA